MSAVVLFPAKADEIVSYNPATGEEVGRVKNTSDEEVRKTVEESRVAFIKWRKTSFAERRGIMMSARDVILSEMEEIARLISDEMGKPVAEAYSTEIAPVLDLMQYFARNAQKILKPEKIDIGHLKFMGRSSRIIYQPLGVVGIISRQKYIR
jgi:succinate-semialdehyde dehydrogenase/glutarate-semialdehyde dehydrogenase